MSGAVRRVGRRPLSAAQHERQAAREGGRYSKLNPCEKCGKSAGANYCSDDRCNTMLKGLVLCKRCALAVADVPDADYEAWFKK